MPMEVSLHLGSIPTAVSSKSPCPGVFIPLLTCVDLKHPRSPLRSSMFLPSANSWSLGMSPSLRIRTEGALRYDIVSLPSICIITENAFCDICRCSPSSPTLEHFEQLSNRCFFFGPFSVVLSEVRTMHLPLHTIKTFGFKFEHYIGLSHRVVLD